MFNATPLWRRVVIAAPRSNIVALALVGSILTLMLTACGSSGNADGSSVSTQADKTDAKRTGRSDNRSHAA